MKKTLLVMSMAVFSATGYAASDNTVQFQGVVSTQTCNVNINGNSASPIVLLPTVAASTLATSGSVAGATKFTVNVTGCSTGSDAASISTVFAGNNVTTNGNLGNTGTAENVSIRLLDSDGSTALAFTNGGTVTTTAFTKAAADTTASQDLTAEYYAEAASPTAGTVAASAQYAIQYN
ncbi:MULTISPECIES: fimbrial protein [Tatumella]|uniref:Fimbrial protein n=1 Tax=Tatumella punctata TaxID=399969 RepID=A0ABW1VPU2_9GAMM|nr:fimbrial protein [Tatumella sp. JGM130]MBS0895621.1 type 1 fimbrial protein [Tatumella sp. JGM130]